MTKILVIDIETTGFYVQDDLILEIGGTFLNLDNGNREKAFHYLVKEEGFHNVEPDSWIFENSNLTIKEILKNGKPIGPIIKELNEKYFSKYPTIAYNQSFDFGFLEDRGAKFPNTLNDPMEIATYVLKIPRYDGSYKWPSVQECLDYFEINEIEPHRGYEDSNLEAQIVYKLYKLGEFTLN